MLTPPSRAVCGLGGLDTRNKIENLQVVQVSNMAIPGKAITTICCDLDMSCKDARRDVVPADVCSSSKNPIRSEQYLR